jgi:hypothetical protein
MLLDRAGFSSAWSESIKQVLWDRADIVQAANLPIERFFDPIFAMTLRYEGTKDRLLASIQEANGELRQKLVRAVPLQGFGPSKRLDLDDYWSHGR